MGGREVTWHPKETGKLESDGNGIDYVEEGREYIILQAEQGAEGYLHLLLPSPASVRFTHVRVTGLLVIVGGATVPGLTS